MSPAVARPPYVIKAMAARWANALVDAGQVRLTNLHIYRRSENPGIADDQEGSGLYRVDGKPFELGDTNPIFVWCASLPDTQSLFALAPDYDTFVRVRDPERFARAVVVAAGRCGITLVPKCGVVSYERGEETSHEEVRRRPWDWNVLQKDARFAGQREFRFAFTYISDVGGMDAQAMEAQLLRELSMPYIDLVVETAAGQVEIV